MARLLLVEDDDGDALLVSELLLDGGEPSELVRATSIRQALGRCGDVECVILDLGLPDSNGLDGLRRLNDVTPDDVAVVVLTGLADRDKGIASLELGAQDYLVKGEVDGPTLARAIRYAIERRRAEAAARRLRNAQRRDEENRRLARGLLPNVELAGSTVNTMTSYRPGGGDALLGGDFYDAVTTSTGTVRAVIGDVCGHGPDEAAIGVALRFTWRALVGEGITADRVLGAVEQALLELDGGSGRYVTLCDVEIDPAARTATVRRAGHPPPLLVRPEVAWLDAVPTSPPLGIVPGRLPPPMEVELPEGWQVLLMTDGVYEGYAGDGRLGTDTLAEVVRALDPAQPALLDRLIDRVTELNGGPLADDVALLALGESIA